MSYSGYSQYLMNDGTIEHRDCWDDNLNQSEYQFVRVVDTTNGSNTRKIPSSWSFPFDEFNLQAGWKITEHRDFENTPYKSRVPTYRVPTQEEIKTFEDQILNDERTDVMNEQH